MQFLAIFALCCMAGAYSALHQEANVVTVGTDGNLYIKKALSDKKCWIRVPNKKGQSVTRVHYRRNGELFGVGKNNHLYKKMHIYDDWKVVQRSCCIKEVTTRYVGGKELIVGVGMNDKMYTKPDIDGEWQGPLEKSCCVKSITFGKDPLSGQENLILGIGRNNELYSKHSLEGKWDGPHANSKSLVDVVVKGSTIYGIQGDKKIYKKAALLSDWNSLSRPWKDVGQSSVCCFKSITFPPEKLSNKITIIGVGRNKGLYYKTPESEAKGWSYVAKSNSVKHISLMKDGTLLGVGTNNKLYKRSSIDSYPWEQVKDSFNVALRSVAQMREGYILGVGTDNNLYLRDSLSTPWKLMVLNSCCFIAVAPLPDGRIIGVGTDKKLYVRRSLYSSWQGPLKNSRGVKDVKVSSNGYLYGVGTDDKVYKKASLSLTSEWVPTPKPCCVLSIAVP